MGKTHQLQEKVKKLKHKVDSRTVVSNWVEFLKYVTEHPGEEPKMTPRFRKWMEEIGARI